MRAPELSTAFGLLLFVSLGPAPSLAQDSEGSVDDAVVDSLVDDAWADRDRLAAVMDEPEGELLELSLEAARAIALTFDLKLEELQEGV